MLRAQEGTMQRVGGKSLQRQRAAAKSSEIMAEMTAGAARPRPCLCLSRPREQTVAADSRDAQFSRLKAPLKLRIRSNRGAVRDEKGSKRTPAF